MAGRIGVLTTSAILGLGAAGCDEVSTGIIPTTDNTPSTTRTVNQFHLNEQREVITMLNDLNLFHSYVCSESFNPYILYYSDGLPMDIRFELLSPSTEPVTVEGERRAAAMRNFIVYEQGGFDHLSEQERAEIRADIAAVFNPQASPEVNALLTNWTERSWVENPDGSTMGGQFFLSIVNAMQISTFNCIRAEAGAGES